MPKKEYFCDKPLKPWITALVCLSLFLVVWVLTHQEDSSSSSELGSNSSGSFQDIANPIARPNDPGTIRQPADGGPFSSRNFGVAAITKATPGGSVQLVANQTYVGFQDSLKDAVNSILPTVCDIHAIWIKRAAAPRRQVRPNTQKIQFLPPFDGVIDKFVRNRGYENIGAGILIDTRGYVLTNYHVVLNATNIIVTVPGNPSKDYQAELTAKDETKDLALLKIKSKDTFPKASLGDSSFTQTGDYVIAVGSPFGMEQTVTSGIISGIRKSINIDGVRYKNLLQTDAPINRGSSGGPLVSLTGDVIGVTTAIYAPTGVFNGTGFAIPINDAKLFITKTLGTRFSAALDKRGMFNNQPANINVAQTGPLPVRFGIEAVNLDRIMAREAGVRNGEGVMINRVFDNSPADMAAIQRGDVITSIAGVPVCSIRDISGVVSHLKKGDSVNIRVIRNGLTDEILVRLW